MRTWLLLREHGVLPTHHHGCSQQWLNLDRGTFPSYAGVDLIPPVFCCLLATGFRHFVGLWRQVRYICGYVACNCTCPMVTSRDHTSKLGLKCDIRLIEHMHSVVWGTPRRHRVQRMQSAHPWEALASFDR